MLELENIIEQIKGKREEKAQLEQLLADKIEQLRTALNSKTEQIDKDIYYLTQTARAEFELLPAKATKTQRKISLLSGDIIVKNATQKLEADKSILLEWGKTNAAEYIDSKVVESFKWADFKKNLKITEDGQVVNTETGEVITNGVEVIDVPEEVVIK